MADFPTFEKNANKPTQPIEITAPAVNPAHVASDRFVEQQWIDAQNSGVGKVHPLSINRDSANVTNDPYDEGA